MTRLVHLLGADIPHHNQTVLAFFNDVLSVKQPTSVPRQFMVVARNKRDFSNFTALDITCYRSENVFAKAVVMRAKPPETHFFFHGQFNPWIWLALLTGEIRASQVFWHVWGADLYEASASLKFRLFYRLRRLAQGKIAHLFAARGDILYYQQRYSQPPASLLYFPTPLASQVAKPEDAPRFTILLGNSGDTSNCHPEALHDVYQLFGNQVNLLIPMGYPSNNEAYISHVRKTAERLFGAQNIQLLSSKSNFSEYIKLITACDMGYFFFRRQQGIGTLCLLIQAGIPFVLNRENPFCCDLAEQKVPVLFRGDPLDRQIVAQARQQLLSLDKARIAFLAPASIVAGWQRALALAGEEQS